VVKFPGVGSKLHSMSSSALRDKLTTDFQISDNPFIGLNSKIFFLGSCFSENIFKALGELQFDVFCNPFGIMYNPVSMANCMEKIANNTVFTETELILHQEKYHSLDHHGSYCNSTPGNLLQQINQNIQDANAFLKQANVIFITLGTAYAYYHKKSNKFVANCHKIPGTEFDKILLSENEIITHLRILEESIFELNPNAKISYTISPVKHLRDGLQENAISKARLLSSLFLFLQTGNFKSDYFPAYEIVTEELRDHRFYGEDLAHPSEWTVRYIFERFVESRMDIRSRDFIEKYSKFLKMEQHRPISTDNTELMAWAEKKNLTLQKIQEEFPEIKKPYFKANSK